MLGKCALVVAVLGGIVDAAGPAARFQVAPDRMPALAIVSRSGQLMPLAAHQDGKWLMLPWPSKDLSSGVDNDAPPAVPKAVAAIPREWFAPLEAMPRTWRLRTLDGMNRDIHLGTPVRWDSGMAESVGIEVDFKDRGSPPAENEDAGIAVAGDGEALPVRRLHEASPEWQAIVRQLSGAFALAERRGERPYRMPVTVPANAALARELAKGEVSLFAVTASNDLTYFYFDTFLIRRGTPASKSLGCSESAAMHVGLLERRSNGPFRVKWLRGGDMSCGALSEGMEVIGAVRTGRETRLVVKYGGDDWASYEIIDPESPESQIRRGPWPR